MILNFFKIFHQNKQDREDEIDHQIHELESDKTLEMIEELQKLRIEMERKFKETTDIELESVVFKESFKHFISSEV